MKTDEQMRDEAADLEWERFLEMSYGIRDGLKVASEKPHIVYIGQFVRPVFKAAWDKCRETPSPEEVGLYEVAKKMKFALQMMIIQFNGPVPGLTDQQVFDGAIQARDEFAAYEAKLVEGTKR